MTEGGIPRIVVRIDPDEHPELAAELAPLHDRSRAGRLRILASMGLLFLRAQQSGPPSQQRATSGTTPQASPAATEVAGTVSAPQPRVRKPTRAAGMMNGLDNRGTSGTSET